jgi:hypothetical protein
MFGVTDTKAAALDKIRTMLAAADAAHTVPDIGSRVRLNNPDSNLDGTNGTVTHHRTFNGHTLVGVRLDDTEYSVGCSLDELQPLDKAVRA